MVVGLTVDLIGTSFGSSAVGSGEALEAAGLESLDTAGCVASAGDTSDFGASPTADVAGVGAGVAVEVVGFVAGAGAADVVGPEAGLADAGTGDGEVVAVESATAGGDPTAGVGFAAGADVLAVPEDGGAGVIESGASEVCVAAGALFVPEISQPKP